MNKYRVIAFWTVIAITGYAAFGQSGAQSGKSKGSSLKAGQTFRDCRSCPEMVVIPPGSFIMGTPKEEEFRRDHEVQHKVTIAYKFAVSKTEVTWDQWEACVQDGACDGVAVENALRLDRDGKPDKDFKDWG